MSSWSLSSSGPSWPRRVRMFGIESGAGDGFLLPPALLGRTYDAGYKAESLSRKVIVLCEAARKLSSLSSRGTSPKSCKSPSTEKEAWFFQSRLRRCYNFSHALNGRASALAGDRGDWRWALQSAYATKAAYPVTNC